MWLGGGGGRLHEKFVCGKYREWSKEKIISLSQFKMASGQGLKQSFASKVAYNNKIIVVSATWIFYNIP